MIAGEITTSAALDYAAIARRTAREIGYDSGDAGFDASAVGVIIALDKQSPDIARGVDAAREARGGRSGDPYDLAGAGDQGMVFGYAASETPELMPMPITLAHALARRLAEVRASGAVPGLRPDPKTQVTVAYDAARRPVRVEKVLISAHHADGVQDKLPGALWSESSPPCCPATCTTPRRCAGSSTSTRRAGSWSAGRWAPPA